jgi:hypothetical protein
MSCTLTMKLVSESQEGNIGEDWRYDLEVRVSSGEQKGEGRIKVPKHNLPSGLVQEPHGSPEPQVVFTGDCADALQVEMRLVATEVDMFVNDVGKVRKELIIQCPGVSGSTVTKDCDIEVAVREMPRIFPQKALFTLRVRFMLNCG